MSALTPRINYLNNRDLLLEIHRSKNSFCYFIDDKYDSYDIIVSSVDDITDELVDQARLKRANKLMQGQKVKAGQPKFTISPEDIEVEDIVWRVMNYDHIPFDPMRSKNPKTEAEKHKKTNFPPFKHFILREGEKVEVGRSHWSGGLQNGYFCQDQGAINRRLAQMFMTLVDRYSQRSNWRGYCIAESDEALTQRGWLRGDQITESDKILSYDEGKMKWSSIKSIFRDKFDGLMHKLDVVGMDMMMTPGHKLVTERGLIPVEYLTEKDKIILMGENIQDPDTTVHNDSFVELMGWIVTEGNYEFCKAGKIRRITVYQNPGAKADRIRNCLNTLNYAFSEGIRKNNLCFAISRDDCRTILKTLPTKNLTMKFILELSHAQRELLLNTMIDGDGWRTGHLLRYVQKDVEHVNMFQALCALSGRRTSARRRDHVAYGKETYIHDVNVFTKRKNHTTVENVNFHGGKRNGRQFIGKGKVYHPNQPTTPYSGMVWCPVTEYGCFLARRNGTVYLTGNTYVSEMRGQALLQLSLVGLQFDEGRSENPFAYFTVVTANAFTRVLNIEKRNQNIRDDILIMNGASPSITRQLDDQLQQKARNAAEDGEDAIQVPMAETKAPARRAMFGRPATAK